MLIAWYQSQSVLQVCQDTIALEVDNYKRTEIFHTVRSAWCVFNHFHAYLGVPCSPSSKNGHFSVCHIYNQIKYSFKSKTENTKPKALKTNKRLTLIS